MTREHLSPARTTVRTGLGVIALAAALSLGTSACQSSTKASVVGQDPATTSAAPAAKSPTGTFKLGQQVKVGSYTVTVHKITYPYVNDTEQPDAGKAFVVLDVEVANSSSSTQSFSSMLQFGLKDSTNAAYAETIVGSVDGTTPDGNIAAGQAMRGPVSFEVPAGAKGLQFSFLPSLTGTPTFIDLGK